MKKIITKFMATFLFCTCFLCMGVTQKANASIDKTYNWGFGIFDVFNSETEEGLIANPTGSNNYVLDTNSVLVGIGFITDCYSGYCYVFVDDSSIGRSDDIDIYQDSKDSGNGHLTLIKIKDLTPGKHKIEVRADRPWNLGYNYGPSQKSDCIYVTVPEK